MIKSKRILGLALSAGLLLAGCGNAAQEQETLSAVLVDAQAAGRGTLVLSNQFMGTVSPEESVYIIPMAQGTVTETFFEVGDEVQAGDVLFKIDDSVAKLQLQQAKLTYTNAQQQADSALTTQQESANMQLDANIKTAEAQYVSAQVAWKNTKDSLDSLEKEVDKAKKAYNQLKKAGADEATLAEAKKGVKALESSYSQLEIQYNQVNAAYEAATVGYESAKEAKELTQGAVLDDTKEQLNTSLQLAKVAVDSAELALSYYQVTTPISGKVLGKNVEVNGMATSASPAYTIAGEDTMVVTFQVSESIMNTLQKNQKIKVERNGAEFDGVITEVGNAVNPQTGLFQIKAAVQANGQELPSGVSVKITSDTYTADNEIIIPYDAVYYETDGSYVYVVKDGRAVKTYVTAGIFDDSSIEIVEGISEGDVVITTWSPRLIDGVEVNANIK
ncbi:MAG: efflux RND transporter periplasmic adaptor subunit [Acetatifactor sp.]|nr:efflux RND transporter periplasmic adaptor subunit [Acetatifactor sp.]